MAIKRDTTRSDSSASIVDTLSSVLQVAPEVAKDDFLTELRSDIIQRVETMRASLVEDTAMRDKP